ncbi:lipocalin family protein [uncultured Capnocytophaga sp.]|uniref:lipocalin family protein n=1 Tax=uncultured Capnocytophaga sp. TaxID=159273 RepID=UPI002597A249|nr:lipocalin family protein [uncultured Capnocytophaga sp.]
MKNKNNNVARATLRAATQVIAILAVVLLVFIGCSKKDDVSNKDLIGTWVYESSTFDGVPEVDEPQDGYIDKPLENCGVKRFYVFTENQVTSGHSVKYYGIDKVLYKCEIKYSKGTYSISGNTISVIWENKKGGSSTFSISGNKLTFTNTGKDETGKTHTLVETFVKQ